jgi:hypothetical protein
MKEMTQTRELELKVERSVGPRKSAACTLDCCGRRFVVDEASRLAT